MRLFAKATVLLLVLLLITSCANPAPVSTSAPATQGTQAPTQATTAAPATSAPAPATTKPAAKSVELKIEVFDRGVQGQLPVDDNYWTQWMQASFGDPNNIKLTYVPVPRSEEVAKLNVLMASNSAPDLVFTYDWTTLYSYYKNGGIADLTDILPKYGTTLTSFIGEVGLEYGKIDGRQYVIPAVSTSPTSSYMYFIRQDWLDAVGMNAPANPDDFYEVLKAFKKHFGDDVYPYGMALGSSIRDLVLSFKEDIGEKEFKAYYGNGKATIFAMPGVKEGYRYLNKLYNEKLISPDFALDKDSSKLDADVVNGVSGVYAYNHYQVLLPNRVISNLHKKDPGAKLSVFLPFEQGMITSLPIGMFVFVPVNSNAKNEVIMYMDWMAHDENVDFLQYGKEGVHYELKNGYKVDKQDVPPDKKMNSEANLDYTPIINGLRFNTVEEVLDARRFKMLPEYQDLFYEAAIKSYVGGYPPPFFKQPNQSQIEFSATLSAKDEEIRVKSIMAAPGNFDATYDALLAEMLEMGGQAVIDEYLKILG